MAKKPWKYIKDPVHRYIRISEDDLKIIDTPLFQRLRNIYHLGTGYLTYPGATHSRFEHSLGVADLGTSVFNHILWNSRENGFDLWEIKKEESDKMKRILRYACLLHDIGHSPFSHTCEEFFKKDSIKVAKELVPKLDFITKPNENTKKILEDKSQTSPHEVIGCSIVLSEFGDILEDSDINPNDVCSIILGRVNKNVPDEFKKHYEVLANIVSSPIDVDKFDYLLRDNYMTGATLVTLDKERLLSAYTVTKKNLLLLSGKALSLVSNLMVGRQQVFMWIYQHHKVVYTDALLRKIIRKLIENDLIDNNNFFSKEAITSDLKDDYDIISEVRSNSKTDREIRELYNSWRKRKFLKACWKHAFEFNNMINSVVQKDLIWDAKNDPIGIEKKLCDELEINPNKVLVAHAKFVPFVPPGLDIRVEVNGVPCLVGEDLGLFTQRMQSYSEVPYVYVKNSDKTKVVTYLKEYSR
jgi:uncharacterized protein